MPERGYYYADLGAPTGCCQSGFRPVLIVSNNTANAHAPVITVVPITLRDKGARGKGIPMRKRQGAFRNGMRCALPCQCRRM